jgi:hypothetical protein
MLTINKINKLVGFKYYIDHLSGSSVRPIFEHYSLLMHGRTKRTVRKVIDAWLEA